MRQFSFFAVVIAVVMLGQATMAQDNKQNVLDAAKAIESNIKSKEAVDQRERALKWLIETKDVNLTVCGPVFGLFSDKKNRSSSMMTLGYTIGMGAFKIGSPDKANDENAAQLAGLLLALRVYENAVADNPKAKFDKIDSLLQKRTAGELPALISGFDCGKK
jgi:hypothetical protein